MARLVRGCRVEKVLPCFCFSTLIDRLGGKAPQFTLPDEFVEMKCPLFVTWKIKDGQHLRGCIGTFGDLNLPLGLEEYAETSALKDGRFNPVQLDEVLTLECGVSLLVQFEDGKDYMDWEVGVHGIRIHFAAQGGQYTATYLPEVAGEQGWAKLEAVDSLIYKSGYKGPVNEALRTSIALQRYQSRKFHATYEEWKVEAGAGLS
eukprot:m.98431 g.98431  ORF g.98431 m.98431 type:complete len:204 (+) comp20563_c0_seq1:20-631(+)